MASTADSRTLQGLNVAILVLAILGVIITLFTLVGSMAAVNYTTENTQSSGTVSTSSSYTSELAEIADALHAFSASDVAAAADEVRELSPTDFATLSAAMDTGSDSRIIRAMNNIGLGKDLSTDQVKALAYLLSLTTASDAADLANQLNAISDTQIQRLADDLESIATTPSTAEELTGSTTSSSVRTGIAVFLAGVFTFVLIALVVSLVASVLGIRNCDKPRKLGAAFALAIVGAVLAFFSVRWVSMVLHIIAAVKTGAVRKVGAGLPDAGQSSEAPESSEYYDYYASTRQDL